MIDAFADVFWIIPDLRCQKRLLILCSSATSITIWRSSPFFTFLPYILANLLGNERPLFVICDWWISIRFACFCVSRFVALYLKRFQRWNFSYRASISGGNTDTEGWKRTDTFQPTFKFADKHSGCYGNGLIDVAEKFEFGACSIWIVEDVGRGSFLFSTYLGRSKETLFAGYSDRSDHMTTRL